MTWRCPSWYCADPERCPPCRLTSAAPRLTMADMTNRRRPETVVSLLCFALMGVLTLTSVTCAHLNSPSGFVSCMSNPKDEAATQQLLWALLDADAMSAVESAYNLAPDAIRCLLQKTASMKGAGPVENGRARKAQQFLDAHQAALQVPFGSKPAGFCPMPGCREGDVAPPPDPGAAPVWEI